MKLLAINGSLAENSNNRKLLVAIQKQFEGTHEIQIADLYDLPPFNESNDQTESEPIQKLVKQIEDAEAVIMATPEYNHSISSALKSALEWLSFNVHPLSNKAVLIVGASSLPQGTSRAQVNLRKILEAPGVGAIAMPGNEFLFANANNRFDTEGLISDEGTRDFLASIMKKFERFASTVAALAIPEEVNFEPGTYEAAAEGHNGPLPMKVTFSNNKIKKIEIDTSGETVGIADIAFKRVPELIIENQTLNVDAIAGASVTTDGILNGVALAVKQAGGDPDVLRKRPKKAAASNKVNREEITTDVVVVVSGGAGLAAAAASLQNGKKVLLLEKFPSIGGNTTRTGGPLNAADPEWQKNFDALPGEASTLEEILETSIDTIHEEYRPDFLELQEQIKAYLESGAEKLFDSTLWHRIQTYLGGVRTDLNGNAVYGNYDLVKTLTDNALDTVHWLEEIGVEFDYTQPQMPVGALWRRGHKPVKNQGYAFVEALGNYVEANGGDIRTDCRVEELLEENGKVVGLIAKDQDDNELVVHANAVVLATGGFGSNTPMLQKYNTYWSEIQDDIATSNSPAITGDGINLGLGVDAELVDMGMIQMLPTCDPDTGQLFIGLQVPPANFMMVNTKGRRFVNEFGSRDEISKAAIDNGTLFYLIADDRIKETAMNTNQEKIDKEVVNGQLYRADTIAELATQIGMDPDVLVEEVNKYNSYVDAGVDPEWHKSAFDLKVEHAPFYATPRKPAVHHTMGGLKINTNTEVIDTKGNVIEGLYAAGEVSGGIHAGNRLGGNALTDIFTYGRIAGNNASK